MTKGELLEAIKDMPMDARVMIRYEDSQYGGEICNDDICIANHYGKWDRGTIIICERL